jgi:protein-disulfide isomerase
MAALKVPITSKDHIQGDPDAPMNLVEYGDYECPFCGRAYYIIKEVQNYFGSKLRFVFRNFPLTQVHPHAESAAETAEFAEEHGRFWEMHDALFENQDRLGLPLYVELAEMLGLPVDGLRLTLTNHEYLPKIREDVLGGIRSGVNGTPTFFINGVRHDGSYEFEEVVAAIEERLTRTRAA